MSLRRPCSPRINGHRPQVSPSSPTSSRPQATGRRMEDHRINGNFVNNFYGGRRGSSINPRWVTSVREKLGREPALIKQSSGGKARSIHRVPQMLLEGNEKHYTPCILSVGPYHRGKQSLRAMEEHKWRYLRLLLTRTGDASLEIYMKSMKEMEERARACYSETINLDSDAFAEMMLVDGCFILELFRMAYDKSSQPQDDPIFNINWIDLYLRRDLVMLENQIPFFILQCLIDLSNKPHGNGKSSFARLSLTQLAINFLQITKLTTGTILEPNQSHDHLHILDLLHSTLIPRCMEHDRTLVQVKLIPCVMELRNAGVKFRKLEGNNNLLDIKFSNGEIQITPLFIQDSTNSNLLNLIAFEQCYRHCTSFVTSFANFMDRLINSPKDVEVLRHNGIIENWLGSDEELASLFNNLGKDAVYDIHACYLSGVLQEVNSYCESTWHVWRASLMHDYFYNPWAIISLVAAVLLLSLTSLQTFFSVFATSTLPALPFPTLPLRYLKDTCIAMELDFRKVFFVGASNLMVKLLSGDCKLGWRLWTLLENVRFLLN